MLVASLSRDVLVSQVVLIFIEIEAYESRGIMLALLRVVGRGAKVSPTSEIRHFDMPSKEHIDYMHHWNACFWILRTWCGHIRQPYKRL